jgi:carbonic anhydrase/acetyltransferase-like protein (isoleucine patch superfamily)
MPDWYRSDSARRRAYRREIACCGRLACKSGTIIPPRSLVMGFPAKVKRPLTDKEVADLEVFWQNYVGYTREYRKEMSL